MVNKLQDKAPKTRITLVSIIRVIIFLLLIILVINYLASQPRSNVLSALDDPTLALDETTPPIAIPDLSPYMPEYIKTKSSELEHSSAIIFIQQQYNNALPEIKSFPQKQIKDLQKNLLRQFYEDALKNIDNQ